MVSTVCLISPNAISREGLSRIVSDEGFKVCCAVNSADEISWDATEGVDLALIDMLDAEDQIHATSEICKYSGGMKPVILAAAFDFEGMVRCFNAGAHGYIVKNMPCSPLIMSLQLVACGQKVMPSDLAEMLPAQRGFASDMALNDQNLVEAGLSARELDVLHYLMAGYANKVIARKLDVSEATIKVHVKAILRKVRVANRTQAALWGAAQGITFDGGYSIAN